MSAPSRQPAMRSGGTIRGRLAAILALPVVAVGVLLAFVSANEIGNYRAATRTADAVKLALGVQDLVRELQIERGVTAGLLGGNEGFRGELTGARGLVDQRRAALAGLDEGDDADRLRAALAGLDGLNGIRTAVDAGRAERVPTFRFFTDRITALSAVDEDLGRTADATLGRSLTAFQALAEVQERTARERAFLNGVFAAGGFKGDEFLQYATMRAEKDAALRRFTDNATAQQRRAADYVMDTGAARTAAYFEGVALAAADGRHLVVNPQSWWSALTTVLDDLQQLLRAVGAQAQARSAALQNEASTRLGVLGGVVLLCFAGAIALLVIAGRSITRPLKLLAAEADAVARHRLPEAVQRAQSGADGPPTPPLPVKVPAFATSEIRSVAGALDRVQAVAHDLATEQAMLRRSTAESLANLGRRNQNLLRRQLGFITDLERDETDPSGLANLFELDHLATRMRRNAESLLVLAGASTTRQWTTPLPISDVIRAAISEVEDYRRVAVRRVDDAFVAGSAISGVSHMLAELVENGLAFSPPDVEVEIHGRHFGDRYLVAVVDQGIGMEPADLAAANERLREPSTAAAPTRYLGHHVVGHLARQYGIRVELTPSPVTGLTARVLLPLGVLAERLAVTAEPSGGNGAGSSARDGNGSRTRRGAEPPAATTIDAPVTFDSGMVEGEAVEPAPLALSARPAVAVTWVDAAGTAVPPPEPSQRAAGAPTVPVQRVPSRSGSPLAAPQPPAAHPGGDGERTRNGLRKRPARSASASGHGPAPAATEVVEHAPAEVRSRLTALRSGVQRRERERADTPPADAPPNEASPNEASPTDTAHDGSAAAHGGAHWAGTGPQGEVGP